MKAWNTRIATRLIALLAFGSCGLASAVEQRLHLTWPDHWELRPPVQRGPALHLQARHQLSGKTVHQLNLIAIDVHAAEKSITDDSLRQLSAKLRDAILPTAVEANIPLQSFANRKGYYFIATDKRYKADESSDFEQLVEGVILHAGYLMNFTLATNDARGAAAREIVRALDQVAIK